MARRYAVALADVVAERGEAGEIQEELTAWEDMMRANEGLVEVFRNPTVPYEQKRRLLTALVERARPLPTTANFLQVLLQNHRLGDLSEVNRQFAHELDKRSGVVTASVTTARPVPQSAQEELRSRLGEITRSRVRLRFEIDADLIGGVLTRIGSTVYDGSVRNQLDQVRKRMVGEK